MTRCCRENMNLKSTGQNYVEQLSVYRSMCSHLRRVLMAKSVVDTRNPRYARAIQRQQRYGSRPATSCKLRFFSERDFCCGKPPSSETIDKLAYDTEHHPSEIIRVTCRNKGSPKERRSCSRSDRRERVAAAAAPAAASNDANCPCCMCTKGHSGKSNVKNQKRTGEECCYAVVDCRTSAQQPGTKEFDYDKQRICDSKSHDEGSPCRSGRSQRKWSLHEEAAVADSPRAGDEQTFRKLAERDEEEALYAKFVYDITQEIVQNGLYTDRELKEVFAKHLERSSMCLNKRKMLYEIYQLKISLNMLDDSEDDDEVEADLVYAEKFANFRVPKPPTPPKVLNENKVIEKLQSFKQHDSADYSGMSSPSGGRKSIVLIDANPEFLVTERDVLTTLADNHVEPEQIQRIYKKLCQKSKDMSLCEAVQVGTEVAYSHRLKQVDRCTSATSLNSTYMRERPHGILRKESPDFLGKSLSPQTSRYRYGHVSDKRHEALEKCADWKTCLCECRTQPCKEHLDLVEKEKAQSPEKIPSKEVQTKDKPQKRPSVLDKKVKVVKHPAKVEKPEKIKAEKPIKVVVKKKEVKSSPEISEHTSSAQEEVITEEKQDLSAKTQSSRSAAREKGPSEEPHEEIEEDIESEIDESPTKSSRRSSISVDKPDNEEKEQASSPEKNDDDDDDEQSSIATENDHDSAKYSDDFSDVSGDSSEDPAKSSSNLSTPKRKVKAGGKYASMKDYFDRFATIDEQKIWRISEGSSDSSSSTSLTNPRGSTENNDAQQQQQQQEMSKIIKKRMSSGMLLKAGASEARREKASGLSSDFYANSVDKFCEPGCRRSTKGCSDNCRFVRTNCRNLSRPTDCLNKLKRPVLSSESTSTSS